MTWEPSCPYCGDHMCQALCWRWSWARHGPLCGEGRGDGDREGDVQRGSLQPGSGHGVQGVTP